MARPPHPGEAIFQTVFAAHGPRKTRLALRAGYGDVYGIAGLVGLLAGVAVTTVAMRLWSLRGGR